MIELVRSIIIPAAYSLLPPAMNDERATRMLLAIMWQESRGIHRAQIKGPARGLWQFERGGGTLEVMTNPRIRKISLDFLTRLCYPDNVNAVYPALEHNDILAAGFARLNLYRFPEPLPETEEAGWRQYYKVWAPGKPKPETWPKAWETATRIMKETKPCW